MSQPGDRGLAPLPGRRPLRSDGSGAAQGREPSSFSIVVPTFARRSQLADCLRSLSELDYPRDRYEVIVVDDGSPEPVDNVVRACGERLDVRLLGQGNQGPGPARNAGAAIAGGRYLAFTDDDCQPTPGWLRDLDEAFRRHPGSLIGGRTLNGLTEDPYATASQIILDVVYAHYNADVAEGSRFLASMNLAMPHALFVELGGFDPRFRMASEDRDLCDRWLGAGHTIVYAPCAVVVHRHRQSLVGFLGTHFRYGRGARRYHAARAARGSGDLRTELRFHSRFLALLCRPLAALDWGNRLRVSALLVLWQASNALGFLYELAVGDEEGRR